jgi:hypothetical protein
MQWGFPPIELTNWMIKTLASPEKLGFFVIDYHHFKQFDSLIEPRKKSH